MELAELKQKSAKELVTLEAELRERMRVLRFEDAAGALKDVREIREIRKTIARILTLRAAANAQVK